MEPYIHMVELKAHKMTTRNGFIMEMKEAFHFPSYFGENLDAVWDCMTDLSWLGVNAIELRIEGWKKANKKPGFDYQSFLAEVKKYWEGKEKKRNGVLISFAIVYL